MSEKSTCPYCKEDIKPGALVCKHCGKSLKKKSKFLLPLVVVAVLIGLPSITFGAYRGYQTYQNDEKISQAKSLKDSERYDDSILSLNSVLTNNPNSRQRAEVVAEKTLIESLKASATNFKDGKDKADNNLCEDARTKLKEVSLTSKDYQEAQKLISDCTTKIESTLREKAISISKTLNITNKETGKPATDQLATANEDYLKAFIAKWEPELSKKSTSPAATTTTTVAKCDKTKQADQIQVLEKVVYIYQTNLLNNQSRIRQAENELAKEGLSSEDKARIQSNIKLYNENIISGTANLGYRQENLKNVREKCQLMSDQSIEDYRKLQS